MRRFVLRAKKGPTDGKSVKAAIGSELHLESAIHTVINALYIAKQTRQDVIFYLVLEASSDYSRTVIFNATEAIYLGGFHEAAIASQIEEALKVGEGLSKEEERNVKTGLSVRAISFEHLVKELSESSKLYTLDRKGEDIREVGLNGDCCFILTDHIPLSKKTGHLLKRLNAEKLKLGPKMLFASQAVVLVHNELDRSAD